VLVDADHPNPVEPCRVIDQYPLSLRENSIVGRVPGHAQPCGDTRHGEMVEHDALQRPPHPATRQLGSLRRGCRDVFAPRAPAPSAPIAADSDQQRGGAMPERLVRQQARVRPPRERLAATCPAPRIRLSNTALDHRPIQADRLARRDEPKLVKTAEHSQVRGREGRVEHVEAFRKMVSVRTSIIGRPRPSSRHRRGPPPPPPQSAKPVFRPLFGLSRSRRRSLRRNRHN
jgi:hypothetical protein